jgi:hypothetical protein
MKEVGVILAVGFIAVGCVLIRAWLTVEGHPWLSAFLPCLWADRFP